MNKWSRQHKVYLRYFSSITNNTNDSYNILDLSKSSEIKDCIAPPAVLYIGTSPYVATQLLKGS